MSPARATRTMTTMVVMLVLLLVAGLFAEGRIERESKTALVVPQTAVNENGSTPWVLKVQDGKTGALLSGIDASMGLTIIFAGLIGGILWNLLGRHSWRQRAPVAGRRPREEADEGVRLHPVG